MSRPLLSSTSATPPARPGLDTYPSAQRTILPIAKLNPGLNNRLEWTIRARVIYKPPTGLWRKGKVLNVNLADESGVIKATCWNEIAENYEHKFELKKVYYISRGYLKPANKDYSWGVKNDYELTITEETTVELCTDAVADVSTTQYNFTPSANIEIARVNSFNESLPIEEGIPPTKRQKKETVTPAKTVELGENDLKSLHHELHSVSDKWYSLGVQLGVSIENLKCIRRENPTISECLLEMLTSWLKRTDPPHTWKALVETLESSPIEEKTLAQQLRDKYYRVHSTSVRSLPAAPSPSQDSPKDLQTEDDEVQKGVTTIPTSPEQQPIHTEAALEHLPSRKRSLQVDGDDTSSAKKPKQSSAKKSKVKTRRPRCGKCIGCQPLKKEDCGQCVVCKDKQKFGGPGKRKQACIYRECQKLKYTSKKPSKVSKNSAQSKGRCRKCIGCLRNDDCGECKGCKGKKKFGGDGKSSRPCRYRECQKLKYACKPSKKCHPPQLGPSVTPPGPTGKRSEQEAESEASSAKQQKQSIGNDPESSVSDSKGPDERKTPDSSVLESSVPESNVPNEMPPSTPMKNEQNATSNNGACIPTDSKLCVEASGPGVMCTTSGEHAVTTAESVVMDSREGTMSNEPTKTEGATATADPTKNEDVSAQTVMMNREKGVTVNQELTKGESNATAKIISPKRKEDTTAENEPLKSPLEHDPFLATHDDVPGPQDDELDTQPKLPELLKFPSKNETINIPEKIGEDYEIFGTFLLNDTRGEKVDAITAEKPEGKTINFTMAILKRWLRGEGVQPVTWRTLVQVLKDSKLSALAKAIEAVKSSCAPIVCWK